MKWFIYQDYGHGTGHGIGHALNVHEGPSAIKERHVPDDQGLRENMFTSNGKRRIIHYPNKL
jgi:Xaa-Pro aminopeptidase